MVKDWKTLLLNKNFWYIWISQIFSQVTVNILNFVLLFTLFEKTGSTIATSFLWISYSLPALLIGPFASATTDIVDRRSLLVLTNLLQASVIFLYALAANTTPFFVYFVVLIYSTLNQFYVPSEFATLPHVVKETLLAQANGLFLITQQASLIIGFGVAGIILSTFGFRDTLIFCSLLTLVAVVATYLLPKMKPTHVIRGDFEKGVTHFFENVLAGIRFITENRFVLAPFLILVSMQVTLAIVTVNVPAIATEVARVPVALAGTYLIVPGGMGAIIASLAIPKWINAGVRKIKIIKYSLTLLVIALFTLTFLFSELNYVYRIIGSFITLICAGFSYVGIIIPSQTFLQKKTPFNFRGRVFGNYYFLVTVLSVFPVILSGTITDIFGSKALMFILITAVSGLLVFLRDREKKYLLPENHVQT